MPAAHEVVASVAVNPVHADSKAVVNLDGDDDLIEVYDSAKHHCRSEEVELIMEHEDGDEEVEHFAIVEHQALDENNGTASGQQHTIVQFHSEEDVELDVGEREANISYQVFGTI